MPSSQNFNLQAAANTGRYGYLPFIGVLPLNLMSCWHFIPQTSRKLTAVLSCFASFQSDSNLSKGPSSQTEVLTLTLLVLLWAPRPALTELPGMWGRRCSPAGPPLISTHWPSGLFSLLCTQLGLGSRDFLRDSAFFFFNIFANQDASRQ